MLLGELYSPGSDSSLSSVTVCHIETLAARRRKRQVHLRMFAADRETEVRKRALAWLLPFPYRVICLARNSPADPLLSGETASPPKWHSQQCMHRKTSLRQFLAHLQCINLIPTLPHSTSRMNPCTEW